MLKIIVKADRLGRLGTWVRVSCVGFLAGRLWGRDRRPGGRGTRPWDGHRCSVRGPGPGIVLGVLSGETAVAVAAREEKASGQSIGRWKTEFLEAGRTAPAAGPGVSRAAPRGPGPAGAGHPPRTSTTRPPESSRPPRRPKPCSTGSRRWTVPPTPGRARPPRSRRSPTTTGRSGPGTSSPPTPSRVTSAPVSEPERASQSLKHERLHRERIDDALDLAREADAHRAGVNTVRPHQAPARNRPRTPTAARPTRPSPTLPTPKPCQPWLSWNRIVSGFAEWEVLEVVVVCSAGDV